MLNKLAGTVGSLSLDGSCTRGLGLNITSGIDANDIGVGAGVLNHLVGSVVGEEVNRVNTLIAYFHVVRKQTSH